MNAAYTTRHAEALAKANGDIHTNPVCASRAAGTLPRERHLRRSDRHRGITDWDPSSVRRLNQKPPGDGDGLVKLWCPW